MNFWAFPQTTNSKSSWNEYITGGVEFSPFFIDANSVTAGKYMEACREGIEDYEYFAMLRSAIDDASSKGVTESALLNQAQQLLVQEPNIVLGSGPTSINQYQWNDGFDRTQADKSRKKLLPVLEDIYRKIPGDADRNGFVELADLQILAANWAENAKVWGQGDFTGEGVVDLRDFAILAAHWNESVWDTYVH
jgi:hypothetical protein